MDNSKPAKITDPAALGESVRSSAEALQQSGNFDELLKEAKSSKETMSFYERHLISYIEQIIENENENEKKKEMPIVESNENTQLVNVQELRTSTKEVNK